MKNALVALLLLVTAPQAQADGRHDWQGYDWRQALFGKCLSVEAGCLAFRSKWDWKRDQWIDITYSLESGGNLLLTQKLSNNDARDSDHVCVTVLFLDEHGANITASHNNVEIGPRFEKSNRDLLKLSPGMLDRIVAVDFGSKQCRDGEGQDDAIHAKVFAELQNVSSR